ncbi:MAG: tRNA-dihydrouridine synthase family protein [Clostridia bacterium]|nr:tRNA-dihydrouridine synthase family protein [Clostridia bacterium]
MQVKSLVVGNTQVKNNIFLAPMAGYTDYPFRKLSLALGFGLCFTELVSAKGLMFGGNGSSELLYSGEDIKYTAAQLFGADAYYLRAACESKYLASFEIVDINMGCPVPKVFKNGEGSALLTDIKKAEYIIKECVKSGKNVTVKIRTGQKAGDDIAADFAMMAENAGAKLITVHGRVREAYYSGEPNFNAIEKAKKAVKIPVIANGGIFTVKDAENMIDRTGADGVMLARGAIANPFLVCELLGNKPKITLKQFITEHVKLMATRYPDKRAALEFRKFTPYYFKGMTGVKELKTALQSAESTAEIISLIEEKL